MESDKNARKSISATMGIFAVVLLVFAIAMVGTASAKSLYVNNDLNANSPISAYDIQPAPTYLVWQQTSSPTRYGGAGLAIDTDSAILFVTFEGSGKVDIVDATNLSILGQVTAPSARNLAGIVVDQDKQKVYAVDRNTNHLYVYSWNATTKTLTNDITTSPYYVSLPNISATGWHGSGLHGIALDEVNDLLYVSDVTTTVKVFNTADWSLAGNFSVSQKVMGIAVDVANGFVYTGNAYPPYGSLGLLSKYDLNTGTETTVNISTLTGLTDNVLGLAVDPATGLLYITTGNQASGGSDQIMVFDSNLNFLYKTGDIGNPTGIVVPGKEISYNPLNLSKSDGLADDACVNPGGTITYTISYTNTNPYNVTGATITDTLPPEVTFVSCTGGCSQSGNTVTWNIGTVTSGASGSVTLVVQVNSSTPANTTITNHATINGIESGTGPTTQGETTDTCACTDADDDGVCGDVDMCANTTIPETTVPSIELGVNRFALIDGDNIFDTVSPGTKGKGKGKSTGPRKSFTIEDTMGCSCEQILASIPDEQKGHIKYGCSISIMEEWIASLD